MRKYRSGKKSVMKKIAVLAVIFAVAVIITIVQFNRRVGPNIDAVSQLRAKGIITQLINEAIKEDFAGKEYEENLFRIKTGKDGKIQMVQSNTSLINKLVSSFAADLQSRYDKIEGKNVKLNYGTILGSKILSQTDLNMNVKVLPLSVSKCDFETEFEAQGINQTKYKIYIVIESNVRVLQPFSSKNFKVKNKMVISEIVIVGEVPDSYVMVPKENILDATD